jgi:putative spermidine/putrescine transport system ATP-binding protein
LNNEISTEVVDGRARLLGTVVPTADGPIRSGRGVALVRPESVAVTVNPAGTAKVTSVAFLGPISLVHCTLADGSPITAQTASARAADLAPGVRVTVGVEPVDVLVVPAGTG